MFLEGAMTIAEGDLAHFLSGDAPPGQIKSLVIELPPLTPPESPYRGGLCWHNTRWD